MDKQCNQGKGNYTKLALYFLHFLLLIAPLKGFTAPTPSTIVPSQVERQLRNTIPSTHSTTSRISVNRYNFLCAILGSSNLAK